MSEAVVACVGEVRDLPDLVERGSRGYFLQSVFFGGFFGYGYTKQAQKEEQAQSLRLVLPF